MRKRLVALIIFAVALLVTPALATDHTVAYGDQTVGITSAGNVDWNPFSTTLYPAPPTVLYVIVAGAAYDVFVIRDGSGTGPVLINETLSAQGTRVLPMGYRCRPYLNFSECTLTATSTVTFVRE
jgi:hypothetical protein